MSSCAEVLRLQRRRQSEDGLAVRVLEETALAALDLQYMPEVAGVEFELLFEARGLLGAERDRMESTREALDHREKLERTEGLAQERVRPCRASLGGRAGVAAQENDADVPSGLVRLE